MPLSPVISTRASVAATILACCRTSCITWLRVMMPADQLSSRSRRTGDLQRAVDSAISSSLSIGFVRKPNAPSALP